MDRFIVALVGASLLFSGCNGSTKGDPGLQGTKGDPGVQGPKGDPGTQGVAGVSASCPAPPVRSAAAGTWDVAFGGNPSAGLLHIAGTDGALVGTWLGFGRNGGTLTGELHGSALRLGLLGQSSGTQDASLLDLTLAADNRRAAGTGTGASVTGAVTIVARP
jgi:hypothetical protein